MKLNRHFIYTKTKEIVSRTYGGCTYTLALFENKGRGKLVRLGETQACTRAHKGEVSEAWTAIFNKMPKRYQNQLMRHPAVVEHNRRGSGTFPNYIHWSLAEKLGIKLEQI